MNSRTPQTPDPELDHRKPLDVEATIKAKGLTAPRVHPQDLDSEIVDAQFYVFPGTTVTVALLMLANGFTVTGESACASPENFDAKLGRDIAYRNAREKLWQLLGFRLKDQLHAASRPAPAVPLGAMNLGRNPPPRREVGRMGAVLQAAARAAHEVNRAYCNSIGDETQVPWDAAPEWQRDSAIEGVRALLANPSLTPEEMHDLWTAHKVADGWTYGDEKDVEAKRHPCLLPYDQLPPVHRAKDYLFRAAVLNAAHAAGWSPDVGPMAGSLAEGASVSPDQIGAEDQTVRVDRDDVGKIAPHVLDAAALTIGAAAGGRVGNAEEFLEERRRRLADKPDHAAGRVDANARVGSTIIDNTPKDA